MINLWDTRYFLLFKIVFKIDHNAFGLIVGSLIYSRFEYNTVLLIFQLWQLGASLCFEIFEITEYLCYFENNTAWQNSFSVLALLFC